MPPRFVNPHFLPESSIAVSRRDIYGENDETGEQEIFSADPQLVKRLNELLEPDLALDAETKRSKRRKIQGHIHSEEEAIAFRLVSNAQPPHPILLRPKSPPPPITREPEIEDNEAQANLRAERAGASALDGSSILSRNVKFMPRFGDPKKLKLATVSSSFLAPPVMMIVECKQPPRSTRPPVPRSLLQHYPYNHGGNVPPSQPLASSSTCPVIAVASNSLSTSNPSHRKRRRKPTRERPAPVFWRPNPSVGGKSLGYAMGFPCSVEVLQSGSNDFTAYPRDTMRKFCPTI